MTAATTTTHRATAAVPAAASAAIPPGMAAELCWHTTQLCRALDHGVTDLQNALAEVTEHVDAILALAVTAPAPDRADEAPCGHRQVRP